MDFYKEIDTITEKYREGKVVIISGSIGIGKSTDLIEAFMESLPPTEKIYVIYNSYFCAQSASRIMIEEDPEIYEAIHSEDTETLKVPSHTSRVIYTTAHYMLSSGLITTAKNIVFDDSSISAYMYDLAKAIVRYRKKKEVIRVALLSNQGLKEKHSYWGKEEDIYDPDYFHVDPDPYKLIMTNDDILTATQKLILEKKIKNVVVFHKNKKSVFQFIGYMRSFLNEHFGDTARIVEITGYDEFDKLIDIEKTRDDFAVNIIVTVNSYSFGPRLQDFNTGISEGVMTMSYRTSSGIVEKDEDISKYRLESRIYSINNHDDALFVLCSSVGIEQREEEDHVIPKKPFYGAIIRMAAYVNISVTDLVFPNFDVHRTKEMQREIELLHSLNLITITKDKKIQSNEATLYTKGLNLGSRALCALYVAHKLNILEEAAPLIAMIDIQDIRQTPFKEIGDGIVHFPSCDWINMIIVLTQILNNNHHIRKSDRFFYSSRNVSERQVKRYRDILSYLKNKNIISSTVTSYAYQINHRTQSVSINDDYELIKKLKAVILASHPEKCHDYENNAIKIPYKPIATQVNEYSAVMKDKRPDVCCAVCYERKLNINDEVGYVDIVTTYTPEEYAFSIPYVNREFLSYP